MKEYKIPNIEIVDIANVDIITVSDETEIVE